MTARGHELADRLVPLMDWIADNADEITGTPAFPGAKAGESSF
ncbi:hypothetical protein [Cryobacterium glucosi]